MGIIDWLLKWLTDKAKPISSKIAFVLFALIIIFVMNDLIGFSFYYINNKKIEHIKNIEEAKSYCGNNPKVQEYINNLEYEALNHKGYIQEFKELFEKKDVNADSDIDSKNNIVDNSKSSDNWNINNVIMKIFPEYPYKSQLIHTITSATLPLLLMLLISFALLVVPFMDIENKLQVWIGVIFFLIFLAAITWVLELVWGLLPVILDRSYINYCIQLLPQILVSVLIWRTSRTKKTVPVSI